jgi:zinc transport system permease protein
MAVGAVFIVLTPGYAPNLSSYLFGNILTVSVNDIMFASVVVAVLCAMLFLFYRPIVFTAFDRDFALTQGVPVRVIEYVMTVFIAVTIVLAIRLVGIMLLMSLLTIPQMTVNLLTSNFKRIVWGSIFVGFLACVAGLFLSYFLQVPSGAFIIIILIVLFLVTKGGLFFIKLKRS